MTRKENPEYFTEAQCESCGSKYNLLINRHYDNVKCSECVEKLFEQLSQEQKGEKNNE